MIVYHHTDMDGKSAGYLVHIMKPKGIIDYPESYIPTNYDDKFDKHTIRDDVVITDISFTEKTYPELKKICETARTVTWIDHHASSVDVINAHKDELQSTKNLTYFVSPAACGAALTYAYFSIPTDILSQIRNIDEDEEYSIGAYYNYSDNTNAEIIVGLLKHSKKDSIKSEWHEFKIALPQWLFHVDDFDSWKQLNPMTEMFKYGFDSYDTAIVKYNKRTDTHYFNNFWKKINHPNFCNDLITEGIPIARFNHSENYRNLKNAFKWTYNGTTFICMNTTKLSSTTFEHLMTKFTAAIAFRYSGSNGLWNYSVYSDKNTSDFDCKAFCEEFGGGGHKNASGFSSVKLIFTDPKYNGNSKEKKPLIFLGGTCNEDPWRTKFISVWNKLIKEDRYSSLKNIKLYNPVVNNWNDAAQKAEEETKNDAMMNLFVITPKMNGVFSIAEAVEQSHFDKAITFFAVFDKYGMFSVSQKKSLEAVGKLIESKPNGKFMYVVDDDIDKIVKSVMESLIK